MPCHSDSDRPLAHSIDLWPHRARSPHVSSHGFMGAALQERVQLFGACSIMGPTGLDDGPDLLLGRSCSEPVGQSLAFEDLHADFNVSSRGLAASPGPSTGSPAALLYSPIRQRAFGATGTNHVDEQPRVYPAGANTS